MAYSNFTVSPKRQAHNRSSTCPQGTRASGFPTFLHGGDPPWYQGYFLDTPHLIGSPKLTGTCAITGGVHPPMIFRGSRMCLICLLRISILLAVFLMFPPR